MHTPVFRNLDQPFRILGLSVFEITFLCVIFAGGRELAAFFRINPFWFFLLPFALGAFFHVLRRGLGDLFVPRLARFLRLPSRMAPKLMNLEGMS